MTKRVALSASGRRSNNIDQKLSSVARWKVHGLRGRYERLARCLGPPVVTAIPTPTIVQTTANTIITNTMGLSMTIH